MKAGSYFAWQQAQNIEDRYDQYPEWDYDPELEEETDSNICPYCGLPMIDDVEVGQGYHVTAPCWMMGSGDHQALQEWFKNQDR